mmetsp:Transcript_21302/g.39133  ORF Transcript_21302/g.39133 Transcript_21302/m.39133 type:complete len:106 (+) Transcript_21302:800-1117(+)
MERRRTDLCKCLEYAVAFSLSSSLLRRSGSATASRWISQNETVHATVQRTRKIEDVDMLLDDDDEEEVQARKQPHVDDDDAEQPMYDEDSQVPEAYHQMPMLSRK